MMEKWTWPPRLPALGDLLKEYYLDGSPLSIADESGVIQALERHFAQAHGRRYALAMSSGTMALYSAFWALGLKPGDEVICTAFSFHATAAPLLHLGVKIVFCDVEDDTGNIDASLLEGLLSPATRAVVSNDQWGHPCDKDAILAFCAKHDLKYVEDCSHAHFSSYKGSYCGTFGDVACWSLQGSKLLSGGEGGILLTDSQDLYEKAVLLGHNLKRPAQSVKNPFYKALHRSGFGLKLRMHPLAALLIDWQLRNCVDDWLRGRSETLSYFQERLQDLGFILPMRIRDYVSSMGAWYGFMPMLPEDSSTDRPDFVRWLNGRGIPAAIPKSPPLPDLALFSDNRFKFGPGYRELPRNCPAARSYFRRIISFPTWTFHEYDNIDACVSAMCDYPR